MSCLIMSPIRHVEAAFSFHQIEEQHMLYVDQPIRSNAGLESTTIGRP